MKKTDIVEVYVRSLKDVIYTNFSYILGKDNDRTLVM